METKNNDIQQLRILLDRFFEGVITPEELDVLYRETDRFSSRNRGYAIEPDSELAAEISVVRSLHHLSSNPPSDYTNSIPEGLEKRLAEHIHSLAFKDKASRRNPILRKIFSYSAAAAVGAFLIFAGYHLYNVPHELTLSSRTTAIAGNLSQPSGQSALSMPYTQPVKDEIAEDSSSEESMARNKKASPSPSGEKNIMPEPSLEDLNISEETEETEETVIQQEAQENIPEIDSEEKYSDETIIFVDSLEGAPYTESVSESVSVPLSFLTAGIGNIYQSWSLVSEALSMAIPKPEQTEKE
ncbi:MAG: hypothetical protein K2H46_11995 [Muribaculaceae bacterium]|nr:hypothetical protein [Muribaculaceae bacterium]